MRDDDEAQRIRRDDQAWEARRRERLAAVRATVRRGAGSGQNTNQRLRLRATAPHEYDPEQVDAAGAMRCEACGREGEDALHGGALPSPPSAKAAAAERGR